jgi:hypothetical protein
LFLAASETGLFDVPHETFIRIRTRIRSVVFILLGFGELNNLQEA